MAAPDVVVVVVVVMAAAMAVVVAAAMAVVAATTETVTEAEAAAQLMPHEPGVAGMMTRPLAPHAVSSVPRRRWFAVVVTTGILSMRRVMQMWTRG